LGAEAVFADTNGSIAGLGVRFELRNSAGVIGTRDSSDGTASMDYQYPTDAATALTMRLTNQTGVPLKSMTMSVQFEVYTNTKLLWNATYDEDSSKHVFTGRLLTVSGAALPDYNVMVCLNETNIMNNTSDVNGWFVFRRHFDVGDDAITCDVQAMFEGQAQ